MRGAWRRSRALSRTNHIIPQNGVFVKRVGEISSGILVFRASLVRAGSDKKENRSEERFPWYSEKRLFLFFLFVVRGLLVSAAEHQVGEDAEDQSAGDFRERDGADF